MNIHSFSLPSRIMKIYKLSIKLILDEYMFNILWAAFLISNFLKLFFLVVRERSFKFCHYFYFYFIYTVFSIENHFNNICFSQQFKKYKYN